MMKKRHRDKKKQKRQHQAALSLAKEK